VRFIGEKFGHYKVEAAIGAGGMGEIYRARDLRLKRDVAIKILPENLLENASAVERFMREARAASALNHPNILTIYDIGEIEKVHFIATEFVEGQTIRERLKKSPFKIEEALDVAIQICSALDAAHAAGIVHRDIKPENIMLRTDGYVKILDFGIAKLSEPVAGEMKNKTGPNAQRDFPAQADAATLAYSATSPGMIIGTAAYLSPEQARGQKVDTRSDIFSLGVVIYEMITGVPPFSGASIADIIAAVLGTEPKPLSEFLRSAAPSELEWIIAKALRKQREERYQTVREMLADLRRLRQRLQFETELRRVSDSGLTNRTHLNEHATLLMPQNQTRTLIKKTRRAIDSLAVLPFVNVTGDEKSEYLSDGITECTINSLSKLPKLRVVPRSTVFRYKGKENDLQRIGEELGVRAVFAGRVMQLGDAIIIKTELVDIANQAHIWGEEYRRTMTDIFSLQDEIAEDIGRKLRLKLTGEDKKKLAKHYTDNAEAYQLYLKGRYFVTTKRTEKFIKKGIGLFQKAIDLDPNYALAYSGIAEAYGFLASSTGGWAPHKAYPKAKAAALKALEIDDRLAEAYCSLGFSRLLYDWDFTGAERDFKRAIELSPNYPNAHDGYGFYLKAVGRHREAIEKGLEVERLDPLSPFAHISLGYAYYFARDFEKAIEECNKALELDRYSTFAYRNLGLAYLQRGSLENAINALSKAVTFSSGGPAFESYLGLAYALAGKRAEAEEVLENLRQSAEKSYVPAYSFAMVYMGLNDIDKTFEYLEKAFAERSGFLPFLKVEPMVDSLRNDPRFEDLLWRIDLMK
jgi:serine/threonine protein kinase/Tfp pilus assembly protein PilF